MKKILHILNTNTFSGAENVVCQIINLFKDDSGFQMYYCSPEGNIEQTLAEKGVSYIPVKKMTVSEISRVVHAVKPDIIHAHDIKATIIASFCRNKCRLICTIHGNDIKMRKLSKKTICSYFPLKWSQHIFWVSASCLNSYIFRRAVSKKSSILQNVIDKKELIEKIEKDTNDYTYEVVYLGRLSKEKNPDRLFSVLKMACCDNMKLKAVIVGEGPLLSSLKEKIKASGLERNIVCKGYMENPIKLLSQAKLLIMTSDWEGTPMCVLEAMALGIPVVSTPTDGIRDLIESDVSGFLSVENCMLARKINEFVRDTEKWNYLSKNVLKRFDEVNNIEKYKQELMKYYKE